MTFTLRTLDDDLRELRDRYAPGSPVLDVARDFETLPPSVAEDLGLFVDGLSPISYPDEWLPDVVPDALRAYAGPTFTVGLPGAGTVVRTTRTDPPAILVKRRAEGTPDTFLAFLIADQLVRIGVEPTSGSELPETFLPFFGPDYIDLDDAIRHPGSVDPDRHPEEEPSRTRFGPADVYQVAAALFEAWAGLHTREVFASWETTFPRLFEAWIDAGERLEGRLPKLAGEVARGETTFPAATEYACSTVRHGLDLPAPFAALDTTAYREHGAPYAVKWAAKTFESMAERETGSRRSESDR